MKRFKRLFLGIISLIIILFSFSLTMAAPSRVEVCTIVQSMPSAENTKQLLQLLKIDRNEVIENLHQLKQTMERLDAEKYGWQNLLGQPNVSEDVQLKTWLIAALRMACE